MRIMVPANSALSSPMRLGRLIRSDTPTPPFSEVLPEDCVDTVGDHKQAATLRDSVGSAIVRHMYSSNSEAAWSGRAVEICQKDRAGGGDPARSSDELVMNSAWNGSPMTCGERSLLPE